MKNKNLVAVDLGGESCRLSLLQWNKGEPSIQEIYRFPNGPVAKGSHLFWNIGRIFDGIKQGLHYCAAETNENIAAIGIDGWACDYVRIRPDGEVEHDPFCYRDERSIKAEKEVHQVIAREKLYKLTGTQLLRFNTLYQLYADSYEGVEQHFPWINIPEFLMYRLGARPAAELTNATHTALVSLDNRDWCTEVFEQLGIDMTAAPAIVPTGCSLGALTSSLGHLTPFAKTQLIAPACHDTASAIAGIPAAGDDWAFISSGTWSLVGTLLDAPCITPEALMGNFSNLGAAGGKFCFLKNVNGMWLLNQCLMTWRSQGYEFPLDELLAACSGSSAPEPLLNVDEPEFLVPGDMPTRINRSLVQSGGAPLGEGYEGIIGMVKLIVHSLTARYAEVLRELVNVTGKTIRRLYIVGGANRNSLLNSLTMDRTGLEIVIGSAESSIIGNFAVQLAALDGEYSPKTGVSYEGVTRWANRLFESNYILPSASRRTLR